MTATLPIPYLSSPSAALQALRPLGRLVLLHSADRSHPSARFDIVAAGPEQWIETYGEHTYIAGLDQRPRSTRRPPFALLEELLADLPDDAPLPADVPFAGGLLGILGYGLAPHAEPALPFEAENGGFPDMAAGVYGWAVVTDHERGVSQLVARRASTRTLRALAERLRQAAHSVTAGVVAGLCRPTLKPEMTRTAYRERFEQVQRYIHTGDCYQVNLAVRFSGPWRGDPWALHRVLSDVQPAPFAGFMETAAGTVLSQSPERFMRVEDRVVEMSPIKGTRPRGENVESDEALRNELAHSAKDQAENLMIVDLLRNDLGKSCLPGSIEVPTLFEVQSFRAVHHLVSTVRGRLAPDATPLQALRRAFPGGSITGAPKIRAMTIIDELEASRRGPYCGSLFLADAGGRLDASIAIRTLLHTDGRLYCWGGGGLVADSRADAEWAEIGAKIGSLVAGSQRRRARSEHASSVSASSA